MHMLFNIFKHFQISQRRMHYHELKLDISIYSIITLQKINSKFLLQFFYVFTRFMGITTGFSFFSNKMSLG